VKWVETHGGGSLSVGWSVVKCCRHRYTLIGVTVGTGQKMHVKARGWVFHVAFNGWIDQCSAIQTLPKTLARGSTITM